MKPITILMTGAGAPGAPGIIKCYRNNGERKVNVIGVDMSDRIPTIKMLDKFFVVPKASDPTFVDLVLKIAIDNNVDIIQPLVTRELEIFSSNISLFEENNIKVCVSSIESLEIANDKRKLLTEMSNKGLVVPKFEYINDKKDFDRVCLKLGYPENKICFKPSKGNGSRGFRIIDNEIDRGKLLFEEKPNSTYIGYDEIKDILSKMKDIPELLIMEFMPGIEYSVDVLANNGETVIAIPRKRTKMNGGISTRCITENNLEVIDYCKKIVKLLNLNGNIGIQVRYDNNNIPKILEINPRVQGSIVCCAAAGVNLPYLAIKQCLGEQLPDISVKWNVEMIRYWNEIYYDEDGLSYTY